MIFNTILFDADGVLFDAKEIHKQALILACREFGFELSEEYHDQHLNGLPTKVKLQILDVSDPKGIETIKQRITFDLIDRYIRPNNDLSDLLTELSTNFNLAICSNAITESVIRMANAANIYQYFSIVLGNESVEHNKPAPDIWLKAASDLKVNIRDCIIVEDSNPGLASALAAMPGVIIPVLNPEDTILQLNKL